MVDTSNAADRQVAIRELGISDLDLLMRWRMEVLDSVFEDEKPWDSETLEAANRDYYEDHLGKDHVACIASVEGVDAACAAICLQVEMPSPDNPSGKCAYVMNVYTKPEFRHQGIASELLQYLIERAKGQGADKIYLEASDMSIPLYEGLGFRPMDGMMKLKGRC